MKASLDTNVIIHFYRAGLQNILFDSFNDGIIIFEQIRYVELENHGQDILTEVDKDIERGKIQLITSSQLKDLHVYKIFEHHVKENKLLYSAGDLGEVYAISLAQTLGTYSLITDDIKPGGPYTSLLQLNYDVMPFNFADILIIRYLSGTIDCEETISNFNTINTTSNLNWSFKSHIKRFISRFWTNCYNDDDPAWMNALVKKHNIHVRSKFQELTKSL